MDSSRPVSGQAALVITNLSKSFSGNAVLSDFHLSVAAGEVHALVGANGSGKSTLIKVLSGFYSPDQGSSILVGGTALRPADPEHAYKLGCRFVHQDLGLVDTLSVLDNLYLTAGFPTKAGTIRRRHSLQLASEMLARLALSVDPQRKVSELSAAERTGVAIARAVRPDTGHPPRVLVLDEPTAALPVDEVQRVLEIVRAAAAGQVAVLYVSHHLSEVHRIADSVSVLRDGRTIARLPMSELDSGDLVTMLVGERLDSVRRTSGSLSAEGASCALRVSHVTARNLDDVSFAIQPGEIVGIAGLDGSGRESVLGAAFGAIPRQSGAVHVGRVEIVPMRPDLAMRAGAAYLPADRKVSGGMMTMTARENLTLADLRPLWRRLALRRRAERHETRRWFEALSVRPATSYGLHLGRFSGGNQQKILFAKWLRRSPDVLLLDDPTQGVDVGAKVELHKHMLAVAERGAAVVVSSTDNDELTLLCSRILVMRRGRIVDELSGSRIDTSEITLGIMADSATSHGEARG
jgi:ribose transport system ATP-binding protein